MLREQLRCEGGRPVGRFGHGGAMAWDGVGGGTVAYSLVQRDQGGISRRYLVVHSGTRPLPLGSLVRGCIAAKMTEPEDTDMRVITRGPSFARPTSP